eukprot:TRINITY_DN18271_c0_g1_i1.p1 TRINITY_DN18271_c0_g1~~TRINITY_DN18271_c0_g1_i1.p1  ORF type:complete len:109 (-),score=16.09 TRINITY_DN18271_c0_g1_i1:103-429(-)
MFDPPSITNHHADVSHHHSFIWVGDHPGFPLLRASSPVKVENAAGHFTLPYESYFLVKYDGTFPSNPFYDQCVRNMKTRVGGNCSSATMMPPTSLHKNGCKHLNSDDP